MADDMPVKIGIDEIVEAAASGVLRALRARDMRAAELVQSGFGVNIMVIAGGQPGIPPLALLRALNPQPLPPVAPEGAMDT